MTQVSYIDNPSVCMCAVGLNESVSIHACASVDTVGVVPGTFKNIIFLSF